MIAAVANCILNCSQSNEGSETGDYNPKNILKPPLSPQGGTLNNRANSLIHYPRENSTIHSGDIVRLNQMDKMLKLSVDSLCQKVCYEQKKSQLQNDCLFLSFEN